MGPLRRRTPRRSKGLQVPVFLQFIFWILMFSLSKLVYMAFCELFIGENSILDSAFLTDLGQESTTTTRESVRRYLRPRMDTKDGCMDVSDHHALMVVHTATSHFQRRQNYRDTYGNYMYTVPYRIKIVFFLGLPQDPSEQVRLNMENSIYGDTVQGAFLDTYQNLSYKAVLSFRWMAFNCRDAKVILKVDDDVIINVHRFFKEFWPPPSFQLDMIYCHSWVNPEVGRRGKWRVTKGEYKRHNFPTYCSGFLVIFPFSVVEPLYRASLTAPFLWVDDVFMYGLVRQESQVIQIVHEDHMEANLDKYYTCRRKYGARCKYWATVSDVPDDKFQGVMATVKAENYAGVPRAVTTESTASNTTMTTTTVMTRTKKRSF